MTVPESTDRTAANESAIADLERAVNNLCFAGTLNAPVSAEPIAQPLADLFCYLIGAASYHLERGAGGDLELIPEPAVMIARLINDAEEPSGE
jgi:hypothetical protein